VALLALFPVTVSLTTALAASWTEIPGYPGAYVDVASVRQDAFPRNENGVINYDNGKMRTDNFTVAWIHILQAQLDATMETIFDCRGKISIMQQVIANDNKDSTYHSFDYTQRIRSAGPNFKSILPGSAYDNAQAVVCDKK
jgi:hypothetical protein